ncbi:MAG: hypothetical protein U0401_34580 [Anaerolineae bacterium]
MSEGKLFNLIQQTQYTFLAGLLLSWLGFSLPWFKLLPEAQWAYEGWQLMQVEGLPWIAFIFGTYGLLFLAGLFFFNAARLSPPVSLSSAW